MSNVLIEKIKAELVKQRFNYKSLSIAAGLGETTVRDIITRRARNPRSDTLQKIAKALGLPLVYFLDDYEEKQKYPPVNPEHLQAYQGLEFVEALPELKFKNVKAVGVRGNDLLPFIKAGSVLYYHKRALLGFDSCFGKLSVVKLKEGVISAGIVMPNRRVGHYDLLRYNSEKTMHAVEMEWCSKVLLIKLV